MYFKTILSMYGYRWPSPLYEIVDFLDISKSFWNEIWKGFTLSRRMGWNVRRMTPFIDAIYDDSFCPAFPRIRRSPVSPRTNCARREMSWLRFSISQQFPEWDIIDHETFSLFLSLLFLFLDFPPRILVSSLTF